MHGMLIAVKWVTPSPTPAPFCSLLHFLLVKNSLGCFHFMEPPAGFSEKCGGATGESILFLFSLLLLLPPPSYLMGGIKGDRFRDLAEE